MLMNQAMINQVMDPRRRMRLLEGDADPLVLPAHHPAWLAPSFAGHRQHEAIRKPERAVDFDPGAGIREAANRAGDGLAAELDGSGFQNAVARRGAVFVHDLRAVVARAILQELWLAAG